MAFYLFIYLHVHTMKLIFYYYTWHLNAKAEQNSECAAVRLQQEVCILPALCSRKQSPSQEKNRSKQT